MKKWLRIHRYLGAFCARRFSSQFRALWQTGQFPQGEERRLDTLAVVKFTSDLHMAEDLEGPTKWAFRGILWLVAASLVMTSSAIAMAFRLEPARGRWPLHRTWRRAAAAALSAFPHEVTARPAPGTGSRRPALLRGEAVDPQREPAIEPDGDVADGPDRRRTTRCGPAAPRPYRWDTQPPRPPSRVISRASVPWNMTPRSEASVTWRC